MILRRIYTCFTMALRWLYAGFTLSSGLHLDVFKGPTRRRNMCDVMFPADGFGVADPLTNLKGRKTAMPESRCSLVAPFVGTIVPRESVARTLKSLHDRLPRLSAFAVFFIIRVPRAWIPTSRPRGGEEVGLVAVQ